MLTARIIKTADVELPFHVIIENEYNSFRVMEFADYVNAREWTENKGYEITYDVILAEQMNAEAGYTVIADETAPITIDQFIAQHNIVMHTTRTNGNPHMRDMPAGSTHHICHIFKRDDKRNGFRITYSRGPAHKEPRPALRDVLDCLALDASAYLNGESFENFCAEFGYDSDSRRAEKTYRAIVDQGALLVHMLGIDAVKTLVYDVQRP